MTLADLYDFETNVTAALDRAIEGAGLNSIEGQRGEARAGHRFELSAMTQGEAEEEDINPHTGDLYRSRFTIGVNVSLRSPIEDRDAHFAARGRFRSLLARPQGLCFLGDELPDYDLVDIQMAETILEEDYGPEAQNELVSDMSYIIRLRLPPSSIPTP